MDENSRTKQGCPQPSDTQPAPSSSLKSHQDQNAADERVGAMAQNIDSTQVNALDQNTANAQASTMNEEPSESMTQRKVAVVTGAGSGLGRLFAQELAKKGWSIVAVGRTRETLEETIATFDSSASFNNGSSFDSDTSADSIATFDSDTSFNSGAVLNSVASSDNTDTPGAQTAPLHLPLVCDIGEEVGVIKMFEQATATFGRLDLLVNNAGAPGPTGEIHTINIDDFDRTVRTNLRGAFLCTQRAFAWMKDHGGGRIINNGSIAATRPRPAAATYAATKAAIASLTVSTNLDGRPYNIRATELDIGNARTDLLGSFTSSEPMFDATRAAQLLASVAELPLDVCVDQLTVTAAGMPFLGRG